MTKLPLLTEDQRATFATEGVLVLPGFYDPASEVEPVQRGIHDVIGR